MFSKQNGKNPCRRLSSLACLPQWQILGCLSTGSSQKQQSLWTLPCRFLRSWLSGSLPQMFRFEQSKIHKRGQIASQRLSHVICHVCPVKPSVNGSLSSLRCPAPASRDRVLNCTPRDAACSLYKNVAFLGGIILVFFCLFCRLGHFSLLFASFWSKNTAEFWS